MEPKKSNGKIICRELKAVRRCIAAENGVELNIPPCTYQGECSGSCPRCEAEMRHLEEALAQRIRVGKVATVAGVVMALSSVSVQAQNNQSGQRSDKDSGAVKLERIENTLKPMTVASDTYSTRGEMFGYETRYDVVMVNSPADIKPILRNRRLRRGILPGSISYIPGAMTQQEVIILSGTPANLPAEYEKNDPAADQMLVPEGILKKED